jgi:putative FmdB family regulatory protein
MPTYDYKCKACGHAFELFQSMTTAPVKTCPKCGKKKVERLIGTGAAVLFKGSGFYITDYRSDSYKKAAEADSKPAAATDAKPATEAKPVADAKPATEAKPPAPASKPAASKSAAKRRSKS